jgi:16S rRNA (guanine527-N7)-methyltransferase
MKTRATAPTEIEEARLALAELAADVEAVQEIQGLPDLADRTLIILRKRAATPKRYPRRPGLAQRRPLSSSPEP